MTVGRGMSNISEAAFMDDIRQTRECAPVRQRNSRGGPTSRHIVARGSRSATCEMGMQTYSCKMPSIEHFTSLPKLVFRAKHLPELIASSCSETPFTQPRHFSFAARCPPASWSELRHFRECHSGQKTGMNTAATPASIRFIGTPMRRKSVNLYPPGT